MMNTQFLPLHINAGPEDLCGNNGIGRYIFLPGSDGRAKEISQYFNNLIVKTHSRGHNLYLGTLSSRGHTIDVASVASGMGCPSMEIILHELFSLGGKRFLRVGTAGSLQPNRVKLGDMVSAHASVRDEFTSFDYVPLAVPAIASCEFAKPIMQAVKKLGITEQFHTGIVHCKGSFYAREFGVGPKRDENNDYINLLSQCGVLASEMETATLFIQSLLYDHQLRQRGEALSNRVLAGAILGILAIPPDTFAIGSQAALIIKNLIELALETIKSLALSELSTYANSDEASETTSDFEKIAE